MQIDSAILHIPHVDCQVVNNASRNGTVRPYSGICMDIMFNGERSSHVIAIV